VFQDILFYRLKSPLSGRELATARHQELLGLGQLRCDLSVKAVLKAHYCLTT